MKYYEYVHRPGYGPDDHMADEIIARASRHLGIAGSDARVAAEVGYLAHPAPMAPLTVRLAAGPGVRRRMQAAIKKGRAEVQRNSCLIEIVLYRASSQVIYRDEYATIFQRTIERRRGRDWVTEETDTFEEHYDDETGEWITELRR